MTVDLATLPDPSTLPIPDDVQPNDRWTPLMVELADHIGAKATLELLAHFGGQQVYIPVDAARSPFRGVIGDTAADELTRVFGRERILLPTGKAAIAHARRQGVLALVRAGELNLTQASRILRTGRRYLGQLINQSREGTGVALPPRPHVRQLDHRQRELFDD